MGGLHSAVAARLSMGLYVGILMLLAVTLPLALACLPHPAAVAYLALQALLLVLPCPDPPPGWAQRLLWTSTRSFAEWSDFQVVYEGGGDGGFTPDQSYMIGYEPHSVLPFALPLVFGPFATHRANTGPVHTLATSMVDWCPGIRHLFHWLGGRPASRATAHALLAAGGSVAVVPGGVAECAYMGPGRDVIYLQRRKGFVRIALQHGASLVPVFCFGQSGCYRFLRLGPPLVPQWLVDRCVRSIRFCPMLIYGWAGTPLPHRVKVYMAVGRPMPLPRTEAPTEAQVQQHLHAFIAAMRRLYESHKAAAGHARSQLTVL